MRSGLAALAIVLWPLAARSAEPLTLAPPTSEERLDALRRARVWESTDVGSKDLFNGPNGTLDFAVDAEISCEFVGKPLTGWTEKFLCRLDDGRVLKVKYNEGERFKEAYGEVLGTRLFWGLGLYADRVLPVRVTCRNCPRRPWKYVRKCRAKRYLDDDGTIGGLPPDAEVGTHTFDPATVEEPLDFARIEERENQGWSWKELKAVDERRGGASRAELDAFKLLNAFIQNADNAHEQNALACPRRELAKDDSGRVRCKRPVLYVDDLGAVFGRGGGTTRFAGRVDYQGWKDRKVWRDREACEARLAALGWIVHPTQLTDPKIGEDGRALLARLLGQLSDEQIADLFRAARIERLGQTMPDGSGGVRKITVADWVALFKEKRAEITEHPGCETSR